MKNDSSDINTKGLILLLCSRLFLFAFFQCAFALIFNSWPASEKYWILTATMTNIVSIIILIFQFRRDKYYTSPSFYSTKRTGKGYPHNSRTYLTKPTDCSCPRFYFK